MYKSENISKLTDDKRKKPHMVQAIQLADGKRKVWSFVTMAEAEAFAEQIKCDVPTSAEEVYTYEFV
jgi:hypothetical protein